MQKAWDAFWKWLDKMYVKKTWTWYESLIMLALILVANVLFYGAVMLVLGQLGEAVPIILTSIVIGGITWAIAYNQGEKKIKDVPKPLAKGTRAYVFLLWSVGIGVLLYLFVRDDWVGRMNLLYMVLVGVIGWGIGYAQGQAKAKKEVPPTPALGMSESEIDQFLIDALNAEIGAYHHNDISHLTPLMKEPALSDFRKSLEWVRNYGVYYVPKVDFANRSVYIRSNTNPLERCHKMVGIPEVDMVRCGEDHLR
jgi:hypothetical protein